MATRGARPSFIGRMAIKDMSRGSIWAVLGVFVLSALSLALRYRLSDPHRPSLPDGTVVATPTPTLATSRTTRSVAIAWAMPQISSAPLGQNPVAHEYAEDKPSTPMESEARKATPPLARNSENRTHIGGAGRYDAASAHYPVVDPDAVIGRPFDHSASVEAGCKLDNSCSDLHQMLFNFSQEPRDPAWASEMEGKLRDLVMQDPKYTVRNTECRMSLCLIEVASVYGVYYKQIPADNPLSHRLLHMVGDWGYELDSNSARVTVTIAPYTRR